MLLILIFGKAFIIPKMRYWQPSKLFQSPSVSFFLWKCHKYWCHTVFTIIKPLYNCKSAIGSCHPLICHQIFISQWCLILLSAERTAVCLQLVLDWHVQIYWESIQGDATKSWVRLLQTCVHSVIQAQMNPLHLILENISAYWATLIGWVAQIKAIMAEFLWGEVRTWKSNSDVFHAETAGISP